MLLSQSSLLTVTLLLSSYILLGPDFCKAQDEGDSCIIDGAQGVCALLQDCSSVYEDLLKGDPPRSVCGYNNFDPVVCCPERTSPSPPKTKPTSTTTTTTTTTEKPISTPGTFNNKNNGITARQKCEEYAQSVYTLQTPPILTANRTPVNVSLCAIKSRKLIVGGKKAEPKEFPHMAIVGFNTEDDGITWQCGGTLISEKFVLTAAHCTYNSNWGAASWVRVGDLNIDRTDDDARPQEIRIIRRVRYPEYRRPSEYHDIALLELETTVTFNAWVRPSCLPYSLPDTGTDGKATATGWGRVDWAEDTSSDLLKITINLIPPVQCNRSFSDGSRDNRLPFGIVNTWQICAGELGKDTCQGDSGGPLVILNQDYNCMYTVIGVTSLGKVCGSIAPGVYTRVSNYIPWIESIVWPDT